MTTVSIVRIQTNFLAQHERQILDWMCARMSPRITPDHLTGLGILGAGAVLSGYLLSWLQPMFLWLAVAGYIAHWLGDSLDGSLARFRNIERPRYGYFVDHSVDAFCNFIIMLGFGATQYARLDIALLALVGYYMLCMYVFLKSHVTGSFQLTFLSFGPTELRIGLIGLTVCMFFVGAVDFNVGRHVFSIYDFALLGMSCGFFSIYVTQSWAQTQRLRAEDACAIPVDASTPLKPSVDISDKLVDASKVAF
jgi:phosphatidylglycerophosphate synthase